MSQVYATVGISGSGKTTWAKEWVRTHNNCVLIDTDDIRAEMWNNPAEQYSLENACLVFQIAYERTREALEKGQDVVFCATSIRRYMRNQLRNITPPKTQVTFVWVKTDLNTALARNAARSRHVPEEVIRDQFARFQPFNANEAYIVINN